jgi:hypothetical protein
MNAGLLPAVLSKRASLRHVLTIGENLDYEENHWLGCASYWQSQFHPV